MSATVATFYSLWEAQLAKAFLENHQIVCFLQDEHIVGVNPFYANAVGGIKLNVHPDHAEKALLLLTEFDSGMHEQTTENTEVPNCTACGSEGVLRLPAEPGTYYNEYRCFDCDNTWDDRQLNNLNPGHIE